MKLMIGLVLVFIGASQIKSQEFNFSALSKTEYKSVNMNNLELIVQNAMQEEEVNETANNSTLTFDESLEPIKDPRNKSWSGYFWGMGISLAIVAAAIIYRRRQV